jgi:hypothetical protein
MRPAAFQFSLVPSILLAIVLKSVVSRMMGLVEKLIGALPMKFLNKLTFLSFFLAFLSLAPAAMAQTIVGTALIGGKKVELLSNNTWRYEGAVKGECQSLGLGLSFCGSTDIWKPTTPPNDATAAQYHFDDRHYGQFIVEGLGSDDGMTKDFMREAVITNGATATGVRATDIPVLAVFDTEVDGKPSETVIYAMNFDGLDVVFANSITILPKRSFQSITFAIGTDYSDRHKELNDELLSLIKIADQ